MNWGLWLRIGAELLGGVAIALLIRRFLFVLSYVKGRSMMNTLRGGEILFALRYAAVRRICRFDVVICRYPGRKNYFVKRIVGLPGERVSMEEGTLFINGNAVEENFERCKSLRAMQEVQLGADEYFVMGDNRPVSRDSRKVGPLRRSQILAKCVAVVFPLRRIHRIH